MTDKLLKIGSLNETLTELGLSLRNDSKFSSLFRQLNKLKGL
jgi:hypothetical protein